MATKKRYVFHCGRWLAKNEDDGSVVREMAAEGDDIKKPQPGDVKEKERKDIYVAPSCTKVHTKRSGMDHTVLPANNTMPAFPSWRSPDVTTTATEAADIQLQLTAHLSTLKG